MRAMDDQPIIDHSSALPVVEDDMPGSSATRSVGASISEGIAVANVLSPKALEPARFPVEDGRRSLAEMARTDLDAALQLLAERAQYITGASGAAIALRRGEHNDMICRASTGSNAPELGALLSMEYGLSGESVRTRQALRCDEAERDPRVNREVCRQLGIASVVVMPIVSEEKVFGVFELLSGKARAFEERDLSALQRLSEMVETAVKHSVAAQTVTVQEPVNVEPEASAAVIAVEEVKVEAPIKDEPHGTETSPIVMPTPPKENLPPEALASTESEHTKTEPAMKTEPATKNPVFWSSAMRAPASSGRSEVAAESMAVPPVLRTLQKCQACGFPVSPGRTFCVECEEKQWRGQRLPQPVAGAAQQERAQAEPQVNRSTKGSPAIAVRKDSPSPQNGSADVQVADNSAPFLSSAVQSESWFAANKYILGALLVVALVIATIVWLR